MAPRRVGNRRGAYLFSVALGWAGLRGGVWIPGDDTIGDGEVGVMGDYCVMVGWWGIEGINGGEE